jgi:hypothetical protein
MVIQCYFINLLTQQQHNKYIYKIRRREVEIKFRFLKNTFHCKSEFILVSLSKAIKFLIMRFIKINKHF